MENELEILRIVKEDVLRILAENNNRISEEFIDNDIKVSKYFMYDMNPIVCTQSKLSQCQLMSLYSIVFKYIFKLFRGHIPQ